MTEVDNLGEDNKVTQETGNSPQDQELTKERYKQIVEGSKKEVAKYKELVLNSEVQKASNDANSLLELHEKDPKLADEVAKKLEFESFDNFKQQLEKQSAPLDEQKFEELYQKRRSQELHEESLTKASNIISEIKDESLRDQAQSYFNKITEGKQLDGKTATEFAEMATLYVNKDKLKSKKLDESLTILGSTTMGSSKKVNNDDNEPKQIIRNGKLITLDPNKQTNG